MSNIAKSVLSLFTFVVTGWSLKLFVPAAQANEKSNIGLTYEAISRSNIKWSEALNLRVPKGGNWAIELHCNMDGVKFMFTLTYKHIGVSDVTEALTLEQIKQGIQRDCRNTPFRDFLVGAFFGRGVNWTLHNVQGLFQEAQGKLTFRCTDGSKMKNGYTQVPIYSDASFDISGGSEDIYAPFAAMKFLPTSMQEKQYSDLNSVASVRITQAKASTLLSGTRESATTTTPEAAIPTIANLEI